MTAQSFGSLSIFLKTDVTPGLAVSRASVVVLQSPTLETVSEPITVLTGGRFVIPISSGTYPLTDDFMSLVLQGLFDLLATGATMCFNLLPLRPSSGVLPLLQGSRHVSESSAMQDVKYSPS